MTESLKDIVLSSIDDELHNSPMEIGSEPETEPTKKKISLSKTLPRISSIQNLDHERLIRDLFGLSIEWTSLKELTSQEIEDEYSTMKKLLNGPMQKITANMAWSLIKGEKCVKLPPDVSETLGKEKRESIERFENYISEKILEARTKVHVECVNQLEDFVTNSQNGDAARVALFKTLSTYAIPRIRGRVLKSEKRLSQDHNNPKPQKVAKRAEDVKLLVPEEIRRLATMEGPRTSIQITKPERIIGRRKSTLETLERDFDVHIRTPRKADSQRFTIRYKTKESLLALTKDERVRKWLVLPQKITLNEKGTKEEVDLETMCVTTIV